jgi:soluble lytic murein transglycosylase-like protein
MVGSAGERGLMQVMPETAREVGVDPSVLHVPEYGILAGTRYLGKMFALFRNLVDTFSAYNGGPDAPYKKTREGLYLNQQYVDKNLIALHAIQYYRGGIMSA